MAVDYYTEADLPVLVRPVSIPANDPQVIVFESGDLVSHGNVNPYTVRLLVQHNLIDESQRDNLVAWFADNRTEVIEVEANDGLTYLGLFSSSTYDVKHATGLRYNLSIELIGTTPKPASVIGDLTATAHAANSGQVVLNWTEPNDNGSAINAYDVQWRELDEDFSAAKQMEVNALTATITNLAVSVQHQFRVRPKSDEGVSGWSQPENATPNGAPAELQSFNIAIDSTTLRVSWSNPAQNGSTITAIELDYTPDGGSSAQVDVSDLNSYLITGLSDNTEYAVFLSFTNAYGTTDSVTMTVTTRSSISDGHRTQPHVLTDYEIESGASGHDLLANYALTGGDNWFRLEASAHDWSGIWTFTQTISGAGSAGIAVGFTTPSNADLNGTTTAYQNSLSSATALTTFSLGEHEFSDKRIIGYFCVRIANADDESDFTALRIRFNAPIPDYAITVNQLTIGTFAIGTPQGVGNSISNWQSSALDYLDGDGDEITFPSPSDYDDIVSVKWHSGIYRLDGCTWNIYATTRTLRGRTANLSYVQISGTVDGAPNLPSVNRGLNEHYSSGIREFSNHDGTPLETWNAGDYTPTVNYQVYGTLRLRARYTWQWNGANLSGWTGTISAQAFDTIPQL